MVSLTTFYLFYDLYLRTIMASDCSGFLFNFSLDKEKSNVQEEIRSNDETIDSNSSTITVAQEVKVQPLHWEILDLIIPNVHSIPGSGIELKYISEQQIHDLPHTKFFIGIENRNYPGMDLESLLKLSDSHHSDLIPSVYEGGLKVWECTFDLIKYLFHSSTKFSGMKVLELGCGSGLPAIFSLMMQAKVIHFHDYNAEVLNYITIPNVILNTRPTDAEIKEKCKFYSGDWNHMPTLLGDSEKYDVILTSETIYSLQSQPKLLTALKKYSRPGSGIVFVAAKSFYFGVGGSVNSFQELVVKDGTFDVSKCATIEASVPRVILKLSHRK